MADPDIQKPTDDLEGFEDANALIKKSLLKVDTVDYSQTTVTPSEEADGSYRVEWQVDDAPMIDFYKRLFPFIGAGILIIAGITFLVLFYTNIGMILMSIALIGWAAYCIFAGIQYRKEKYTFLVGIDNFSIVHDGVFHSEKTYDYNELQGIDLLTTGTEETWGQTMAVKEKMGRYQISGKKESVQLLAKTLDVFFRNVRAKRKKLGKGDALTVVGQ